MDQKLLDFSLQAVVNLVESWDNRAVVQIDGAALCGLSGRDIVMTGVVDSPGAPQKTLFAICHEEQVCDEEPAHRLMLKLDLGGRGAKAVITRQPTGGLYYEMENTYHHQTLSIPVPRLVPALI